MKSLFDSHMGYPKLKKKSELEEKKKSKENHVYNRCRTKATDIIFLWPFQYEPEDDDLRWTFIMCRIDIDYDFSSSFMLISDLFLSISLSFFALDLCFTFVMEFSFVWFLWLASSLVWLVVLLAFVAVNKRRIKADQPNYIASSMLFNNSCSTCYYLLNKRQSW